MRDPEEDIWVRRHIPGTLALITSQKSVDVLVGALEETDGFLRFKVIAALDRLRRTDAPLTFPTREAGAGWRSAKGHQFFNYLSLLDNLVRAKVPGRRPARQGAPREDGAGRSRIYNLLALMYPWRDIGAAEWTLRHGEARAAAPAHPSTSTTS